jgi:flagella basal body P-ring formation protein FlgA
VHFNPTVTVSGSRIVLGDIATIQGAGDQHKALARLPVGSSPAPGKSKDFYTVSVINSLQHRRGVTNIDWQGSPNIAVTRTATRISKKQIEAILGQFLQDNRNKLPKADIRLQILRAPDELILPEGNVTWQVTPSRAAILDSSSFSIAFAVNGTPAGNCIVRSRLKALANVAVAAVSLQRGERVKQSSIRLEKRDISKLDAPYTELAELIGKETLKTINAGTVLEHDFIGLPSIVHKGEMVTIVARRGTMRLTTKGLSRENGRKGEMIRVKNISSNKMVYCRVDRPGMVSVEF